MDCRSYHVDWFVTRDARRDVTLRIVDGRLVGIESGRSSDAIPLENVTVISGLVNAHTHLEFSRLATPIPTQGRFTDWIRAVVTHRRLHPTDVGDSIRTGVQESWESGTTLLGEIATVGWSFEDYLSTSFHGIIFQELLGLSPERVTQQHALAQSHVGSVPNALTAGLSPHAPYSTHLTLLDESVRLANQTGCVVAMHLAETSSELELLADGTGEFREMLMDFGLWNPALFPGGRWPLDYLQRMSQAPRSVVVHGNYLDDRELNYIAKHPQMTLVYCPRTHAAFGHPPHPWRRLRELGGHVALGTDSRASNPDLSLFAELQFLAAEHPDLSHLELLQLGSSEGRRALGMEGLDRADFTLIESTNGSIQSPEQEIFSSATRVCGTMIGGTWAWLAERLRNQLEPTPND